MKRSLTLSIEDFEPLVIPRLGKQPDRHKVHAAHIALDGRYGRFVFLGPGKLKFPMSVTITFAGIAVEVDGETWIIERVITWKKDGEIWRDGEWTEYLRTGDSNPNFAIELMLKKPGLLRRFVLWLQELQVEAKSFSLDE